MAGYGNFRRGSKEFPLSYERGRTLLQDADPFIYYGLSFFRQMIEVHVGERLMAAADGTPVEAPVAMVLPTDPGPYFTSGQIKFPLLALYRTRGRFEDRTVQYRHDITTFELLYALPPLTLADAVRVGPILNAIKDVIDDRAERGSDPAMTPPGDSAGGEFWTLSGVERIDIDSCEWGTYSGLDGEPFMALKITGSVREETAPTQATGAYEDFAGINGHIDHVSPDGSELLDVAQDKTLQAPTVASLSVATGSVAGGTAVTITGTLFQAPASVTFAGASAANVVVVNSTTITCVTPAQLASFAGELADVVVSTDFGDGTLADAFTYT